MTVLVTGRSGSGKSTCAPRIAEALDSATLLRQDDFFCGAFTPYAEAEDDVMERPEHIDWDRLCAAVAAAHRDGAAVVVVEGHNLLCCARLRAAATLVLCLAAPRDACRERRVARSPRTAAQREVLRSYYDRHVAPAHDRFGGAATRALVAAQSRPASDEPPAIEIDAAVGDAAAVAARCCAEARAALRLLRRAAAVPPPPPPLPPPLAKLAVRMLCDVLPPAPPQALYVFSELPENATATFAAAARARALFPTLRVLLAGEDGTRCPGFGGRDAVEHGLLAAGIPRSALETVPFDPAERLIHTKNEAEFLVQHCRRRGYRVVLVTAPAFHQLRAFATTCSTALCKAQPLWIYGFPANAQGWLETVTHSQGVVTARRVELIDSELERIERYMQKGDIESAATLLRYLELRDATVR